MHLSELTYRISTDSAFAGMFRKAPRSALASANLNLSQDELHTILQFLDAETERDQHPAQDPPELPWFSPQFRN
jgi:hypothetical protein